MTDNYKISLLDENNREPVEYNNNQEEEEPTETNHDEEISLLFDMGFSLSMINKVYIFLHPQNLQQAIQMMTQENGIYQHNFFERHNSGDNKCYICGGAPRAHMDFEEESDTFVDTLIDRFSIRDEDRFFRPKVYESSYNGNNDDLLINVNTNDSRQSRGSIKSESINECKVCFGDVTESEKKNNYIGCGHIFCDVCWTEYLKQKIVLSNVSKIKCMDSACKQTVSEEFILSKIHNDSKLMEKYQKFKISAEIIENPNKKFCPSPNCNSYLERDPKNKYVQCQNGHKYCFNCAKPWHGGLDCQDEIDKDFQKWKKKTVVKRCPHCKIYTEKNKGCNHMTCVKCQYQWCWLCEKKYTTDHYYTGTCEGLQFAQRNDVPKQSPCRNCKKKFWDLVWFLLKLACVWFFSAPFFFGAFIVNAIIDYQLPDMYSIPSIIICLITALAYGIFFQPLFSVLVTPLIVLLIIIPTLMKSFSDCIEHLF